MKYPLSRVCAFPQKGATDSLWGRALGLTPSLLWGKGLLAKVRSLASLASRSASLLAALTMAGLVAGCGPSNDAPTGRQGAAQTRAQPAAVVAVARGKVEVEGGLLELSPATAGMVQQIAVEEGQSVKRGQLLLRLADETAQADLGVAESELALAQARHKSRLARLPQLRQSLERWRAAEHADAADRQSVDEAAQALRDAEAEVALSQAEARVAQRKLEQLRALQKRHELRAPEAAVVARLNTAVGSQAQPGLTALVLLPARPLQVRAEINESFASAVKPGMKATVVLDGDGSPAATLPEARVARISPVYGLARLQEDQQRGPVRVVESVLRFEQPPSGLRVGQNVRVQFHE